MYFEGFDMWSDKYLVPYIEVYVSLLLYEAENYFRSVLQQIRSR